MPVIPNPKERVIGALTRYTQVSGVLLGTTPPAAAMLGRRYGLAAARRFAMGMVGTLVAQQALVGVALGRGDPERDGVYKLTLVDAMTLSRGCSSAILVGLIVSGARDRRGLAGWMSWLALLYGAILCDWLDGPIARRLGASELGAQFDLEADSWLTLCSAGAAVAWGELPVTAAIAPVMRYIVMFSALRDTPYAELNSNEPRWIRPLGIVQMLLYLAALAPFAGRATRLVTRVVAPIQTSLQLGCLVLTRQRGST